MALRIRKLWHLESDKILSASDMSRYCYGHSTKLHEIKLLRVFFINSSAAEIVITVDVHKAKDLLQSGHPYLEVRTEEELKKGHADAEKIVNIPYMFFKPEGRMKNPRFVEEVLAACNKDDHLVVGCQSGVRSLGATTDLVNTGFKHVFNMDGGYAAWVEKGSL
ncbi:thiosulfate sulfurtransferase 18-like [Cornus florida]|uniref:thiosulfate sulfurtransferase 18-like n=1 Tax=Cornus florida TaxID=4283 RepID=UPI00289BE4F0|nr:thiosulfate sulfurtransferase 18-like [Cornus florida]